MLKKDFMDILCEIFEERKLDNNFISCISNVIFYVENIFIFLALHRVLELVHECLVLNVMKRE